jgi:hypothetical protein
MVALDSLGETESAQQRPKVFESDVRICRATEYLKKNSLAHTSIIAAAVRPRDPMRPASSAVDTRA